MMEKTKVSDVITEDGKISSDVQRAIIENKIALWKNSRYDAELDARVAAALKNDAMLKQAEGRMKEALQAIDLLKDILADLPQVASPPPQTSL